MEKMISVVLDNDVLIKGAAYELLKELVQAIPAVEEDIGLLGASRFLVPSRLKKSELNKEYEVVILHFEKLAEKANFIEPTEEESKFAGELEFLAQKKNLSLDSGESQLLAVLKVRALNKMVTGDKRAIASMEVVSEELINIEEMRGKVTCLEQLFCILIRKLGQTVCEQVCQEPHIDKTLSICFCCHNAESTADQWVEGLKSYIDDIRRQAPILLSP